MSKASVVNVFPLVTAWDALSAPVAIKVVPDFVIAQWVAVPVPVTEPSVMAAIVTLRPFGVLSPGAPIDSDDLFPRAYVLDASVYVVASCDVM